MAAEQVRLNKVGNVVKKELWPEEFYCRELITLTYAGLGKQEVGEIVVDPAASGTYAAAGAAIDPAADLVAVVIDPTIEELIAADIAGPATGTVDVVAIVNGPATLRKGALSIADDTDVADAYAVLVANRIKLVDFFSIRLQKQL